MTFWAPLKLEALNKCPNFPPDSYGPVVGGYAHFKSHCAGTSSREGELLF